MTGWLAMEHLLLMTVGARRAGRCLIVIQIIVVVVVIHVSFFLLLVENPGFGRKPLETRSLWSFSRRRLGLTDVLLLGRVQ